MPWLVKFVVSTTSVSFSHQPRESPEYCLIADPWERRPVNGTIRAL
jgi:hypothetical protein